MKYDIDLKCFVAESHAGEIILVSRVKAEKTINNMVTYCGRDRFKIPSIKILRVFYPTLTLRDAHDIVEIVWIDLNYFQE